MNMFEGRQGGIRHTVVNALAFGMGDLGLIPTHLTMQQVWGLLGHDNILGQMQ